MRRWIPIAIVLLVAGLALTAFVRQDAPRSTIVQTIGVLPRTPFDEKSCGWFVRETPLGALPNGGIRCDWNRPPSASRQLEHDQIFYHVVSRDVKYAERSWEPTNRTRWLKDLDSVRVALGKRGGVPSCQQWVVRSDTTVREFWLFPEFQVMLFAGELAPSPQLPQRGGSWAVLLRVQRGQHPLC